jgi:hypothetical protein
MKDIQRVCVLQDAHSGVEIFRTPFIDVSGKHSTQSPY